LINQWCKPSPPTLWVCSSFLPDFVMTWKKSQGASGGDTKKTTGKSPRCFGKND
jgi:hypothetical protein